MHGGFKEKDLYVHSSLEKVFLEHFCKHADEQGCIFLFVTVIYLVSTMTST